MGAITISLCVSILVSVFLFQSYLHNGVAVAASEELARSEREALEIIIGGGGGGGYAPAPSPKYEKPPSDCPPPPPPPCPPPPPPTITRLEKARRVLVKFAREIDDLKGFTKNWKGPDPCIYKGVKCDTYPHPKERAVSGLDFNQAGFSGHQCSNLSTSVILGIPELTFFHVNSNNFTGAISEQITKSPFFFELDLSNNKLIGKFPREVLGAKRLVFLDLRFNRFSGPVPPELFEMKLDVIFINNNKFCQNLPGNFGSTPARYLTFANNEFTGPIPSSIGKASNTLTEVLFLGNHFSGCLPYEIGYLKKATVFDVSKNWLTGPIPHSFACLEKIQFLNLAQNMFYGPVPEMVCQLPGLRNNGNLTLSGNYFTWVGPECRKLIKANVLDVSQNCVLGLPNQRSQADCSAFFSSVKPCPNSKSLTYIPCKKYYSNSETTKVSSETTASSPPSPVTYNSLNPSPHRL